MLLDSLDPSTIKWGHKLLKASEKELGGDGKTGYQLEFDNAEKIEVDFVVGAVSSGDRFSDKGSVGC